MYEFAPMKTTLSTFALSFCLVAAAVGCKKKDAPEAAPGAAPATGAKAAAAAPAAAPAAGGLDFSEWDQAGKAKAWLGSWLAKENGTIQAWTVAGDTIQTWDGKDEKKFKLDVTAPCRASFVMDGGGSMPREFASVDGKLQFRGDGAGYRKGGEVLFCDPAGDFYTIDASGACALWTADHFDHKKLTKGPGVCSIKKNAKGEEVFVYEGTNSGEFEIHGDAILSHASFETQKVDGDFAAGKAARDKADAAK